MTRVGPRKHALDHRGCTLAPPGEYIWTVRMRRQCGLLVKLLRPLIIYLFILCFITPYY